MKSTPQDRSPTGAESAAGSSGSALPPPCDCVHCVVWWELCRDLTRSMALKLDREIMAALNNDHEDDGA